MGFRPEPGNHERRLDDRTAAAGCFQTSGQLAARYLGGLPSNRELIEHVAARGMKRI
jgi:hypothetical protein